MEPGRPTRVPARRGRGAPHLAEYHVLVVQPVAGVAREEELAAIRVGARVGHGEQARPGVLEVEVLVIKLVAVYRDATCAIPFDKVSTLTHEALDDSVEGAPLVADGLTGLPAVHKARAEVWGQAGWE